MRIRHFHLCDDLFKCLWTSRRVYTDDKCMGKGSAASAGLHGHSLLTNGAVVEEGGEFHASAEPGKRDKTSVIKSNYK